MVGLNLSATVTGLILGLARLVYKYNGSELSVYPYSGIFPDQSLDHWMTNMSCRIIHYSGIFPDQSLDHWMTNTSCQFIHYSAIFCDQSLDNWMTKRVVGSSIIQGFSLISPQTTVWLIQVVGLSIIQGFSLTQMKCALKCNYVYTFVINGDYINVHSSNTHQSYTDRIYLTAIAVKMFCYLHNYPTDVTFF